MPWNSYVLTFEEAEETEVRMERLLLQQAQLQLLNAPLPQHLVDELTATGQQRTLLRNTRHARRNQVHFNNPRGVPIRSGLETRAFKHAAENGFLYEPLTYCIGGGVRMAHVAAIQRNAQAAGVPLPRPADLHRPVICYRNGQGNIVRGPPPA